MAKETRDLGASVRDRLFRISKEKGQSFDLILTRYAIERLLYRLAQSSYADRFVLKGAMLLMVWFDEPFRSTRDLDLLGYGDPTPERLIDVFKEVLALDAEDGVLFEVDNVRISRIRADNPYGGQRLRTTAEIGGARIAVNVDVGFGDATEPVPETLDYPVILDMPAPRLQGYARETVVAEKFQAMVAFGSTNSRMKDYYDVWMLYKSFDFDRDRLALAVAATFARRETIIPKELPDSLKPSFAEMPAKRQQWEAFKRNVAIDPGQLADVLKGLGDFLMPVAAAAQRKSW